MANPGEKNVSAYVNPKVAEVFSGQVEERGYLKRKAVEGALRAFIVLPDELQVALMKSNNQNVYNLLVHSLRDRELSKNLKALTPRQRLVLIELAKEGSKRLFPKGKAPK